MLSDTKIIEMHPDIERILSMIGGNKPADPFHIDFGMYIINHFNGGDCLEVDNDIFFDLDENYKFNNYGVCDSPEQFQNHPIYEFLKNDARKFCVVFTPVLKSEQEEYGWRWHKWGPYIGEKDPQHEYLADEDDSIDRVFVYHVYKVN